MNIYQYVSEIDNLSKFKYIAVILATILAVRILDPSPRLIIGLFFGLLLVAYLQSRERWTGNNFFAAMDDHLKSPALSRTRNFQLDSELIIFIDSISEYQKYNPAVFRQLVRQLDQFLGLTRDMEQGLEGMGEIYDVMDQLKTEILNSFHSFIYRLPNHPKTMSKHQEKRDGLERQLNYHLDLAYQYMVYAYGQRGINNKTRFIYKNHPKPADSLFDRQYEFN